MSESNSVCNKSRVALIQACWHKDIVERCRDGFLTEMGSLGFSRERIDLFLVPGSLEIPLQAKLLAKSGVYCAVAATGFVVDGGIYRHDFVAHVVIQGLMDAQLATEVPVLSAVLTPHNFHEHEAHQKFFQDHLELKGRELAQACIATIRSIASARGLATGACVAVSAGKGVES